jgi:hypothetical protein
VCIRFIDLFDVAIGLKTIVQELASWAFATDYDEG